MRGDEAIGPTAHYTAYVWYWLRLPYAHLFRTRKGARLFWSFRCALEWPTLLAPDLPTMPGWLGLRHRTIERALVGVDPGAVVEVAAGLSRRGVTWALERRIPYLELDLPVMSAAKSALLRRRAPEALRRRAERHLALEACDVFADGFPERAARALDGHARPCVITEGLTSYFEVDDRVRIFAAVHEALRRAGGGTYLFDTRSEELMDRVRGSAAIVTLGARFATRGRGYPRNHRTLDDCLDAVRAVGFTDARVVPYPDDDPAGRLSPTRIIEARL